MKTAALIGIVAMGLLAAACATSPTPSATPETLLPTSTPTTLPTVVTPPTSEPLATPTAARGGWSLGAGMIAPYRSEMPAVELDGLVYVPGGFGGETRLERYDPIADEWRALANMPAGRHHLMAAVHDGRLYVFGGSTPGGFNPTDTVWRYDPREDAWTDLGVMPERRMSGAAVTIGEKIYVVGGVGDRDGVLEFTPSSGEWRMLPGGNAPRDHANAVALDGKVWLIGGRGPTGETNAVETFDPATETWSDGPSLNGA